MHQPREALWSGILRILVYIKSCPGKGLVYRNHGHIRISGYSDSGYAGDRENMNSTTGYYMFVGGNLMTWRNKKMLYLAQVQKQSIKLWLILHVRLFG